VPQSWALDRQPASKTRLRSGSSVGKFKTSRMIRPHWMSHMQPGVPVSLRDQAVRAHWHSAAVRARRG
jgi:hypothetical protein